MKEWYLIGSQTKPNMIGGYENQAFLDYKDDAFMEALTTDIADTVTIYNYDLSESFEVRCITQGNLADTQLKSLERTVLFPTGAVKAGQYIYFNNNYWLIIGYPGSNKVYSKVVVSLCQYLLRWQNNEGQIIERWMAHSSASKYSMGEKEGAVQTLVSDDFAILIPNDEESLNIDGKRVFIDTNKKNPKKTFKVTRNNDALYDYGANGGVLYLIADRDEFNPKTDNQELMICDYISPDEPTTPLPPNKSDILTRIEGNKKLKLGYKKVYTASFFDKDNKSVNVPLDFSWNVICDFSDVLEQEIDGNSISFFIDDEDYLDEKFVLQALIGGQVVDSMTITVSGVYGA